VSFALVATYDCIPVWPYHLAALIDGQVALPPVFAILVHLSGNWAPFFPCHVDDGNIGGKERELFLLLLWVVLLDSSRQVLSLPTIVRRYGRKDKSGRTRLCLVRVGVSSPLGPCGPGSGRADESYATITKPNQKLYLDLIMVVYWLCWNMCCPSDVSFATKS
jgi:hypothetical protein